MKINNDALYYFQEIDKLLRHRLVLLADLSHDFAIRCNKEGLLSTGMFQNFERKQLLKQDIPDYQIQIEGAEIFVSRVEGMDGHRYVMPRELFKMDESELKGVFDHNITDGYCIACRNRDKMLDCLRFGRLSDLFVDIVYPVNGFWVCHFCHNYATKKVEVL
jgi:hypothetical protein